MITTKIIPYGHAGKSEILVMYLGTPIGVVRGQKLLFNPWNYINDHEFQCITKKWLKPRANDVLIYQNKGENLIINGFEFTDFLLIYDLIQNDATELVYSALESAKKNNYSSVAIPIIKSGDYTDSVWTDKVPAKKFTEIRIALKRFARENSDVSMEVTFLLTNCYKPKLYPIDEVIVIAKEYFEIGGD